MNLERQKRLHRGLTEALALLHAPPALSEEERARIAAELAKPRDSAQPELALPIPERGPCR